MYRKGYLLITIYGNLLFTLSNFFWLMYNWLTITAVIWFYGPTNQY